MLHVTSSIQAILNFDMLQVKFFFQSQNYIKIGPVKLFDERFDSRLEYSKSNLVPYERGNEQYIIDANHLHIHVHLVL